MEYLRIFAAMIKNLVFDFGRVLVDYDFKAYVHRCGWKDKETEESFLSIVGSREFTDICDIEDIPFAERIEEYARKNPEFTDAFHYFHDHYQELITGEVEGMAELLVTLKQKGFRLYGLSNWSSAVYEVMRRHSIFRLLDDRVVSCEEHIIKPQKEFYLLLCERFALKPEECLFTDDKRINIDGAIAAGMNAVLFKSARQYAEELEKYL